MEKNILLPILMNIMLYEVKNQNYLLVILEELATQKAKQNNTNIEDELQKLKIAHKKKETEATLLLAKNIMAIMPELKSDEIQKFMETLKAANN